MITNIPALSQEGSFCKAASSNVNCLAVALSLLKRVEFFMPCCLLLVEPKVHDPSTDCGHYLQSKSILQSTYKLCARS